METNDKLCTKTIIERDILLSCDKEIRGIIEKMDELILEEVDEIRIRVNKPLMFYGSHGDFMMDIYGKKLNDLRKAYIISESNILRTLELMSENSLYAYQEEIKNGFLTLKGGHRVGICGKVVSERNDIKTIKNISALNIRIARQIKNCARKIAPLLINQNDIYHTLIISPPNCGKTTLLRDIIRLLSNGDKESGLKGFKVGLVDERSEIASCYKGIAQNDVGIRTDILDSCPKSQGILILTRSMSPHIIATDELGTNQDIYAVEQAINTGIKIITTAHAGNIEELSRRNGIGDLYRSGLFERVVVLSNRKGAGTIEDVYDVLTSNSVWRNTNVY